MITLRDDSMNQRRFLVGTCRTNTPLLTEKILLNRNRACFLVLLLLSMAGYGSADDLQLNDGGNGTYLRLKQLQTPVSVLHVVAHPDDEDGGLLAYCARELGVRTMLFSLTRGEGGANLISSHFFDELGALRTLEHQKAASYYGNELFYSRAADYGYSKSLEEAMRQWQNGVPLLEDLVAVIRREQPTILLSRFAGDSRDGHGHHQMAGVLSRQAIDAAADATQFPEQIRRGLKPWQIEKFYVRAGSPWRPPQDGEWTIALPIGKYDPVIGKSPAQIARFGLGFQRSQGMSGHIGDAGPRSSYYRLERPAQGSPAMNETSLFDGLDISWAGLLAETDDKWVETRRDLQSLDTELASVLAGWNPRNPQSCYQALIAIRTRLLTVAEKELPDRISSKLLRLDKQVDDAILHTAGIKVESWATTVEDEAINHLTPGEALKVHVRVANQGCCAAKIVSADIAFPDARKEMTMNEKQLNAESVAAFDTTFRLPSTTPVTRPHWSRQDAADPLYRVAQGGNQLPAPTHPLQVHTRVSLDGLHLDVVTVVEVRRRDAELGNVRYPLAIVPDKSVSFSLDSLVLPKKKSKFSTSVSVRNSSKQADNATVSLDLPPGWISQPGSHELRFEREDEQTSVTFEVSVPASVAEQAYEMRAIVRGHAGEFREGFETITARDLGRMNVYHDAVQRVQVVDVNLQGRPNVGYVSGSGDRVAESLAPLGVVPTFLNEADLSDSDLRRFDVILVGVRAYAVRDDLRAYNSRLLEYVKQGGVLIVQYQTPEFDDNFGPYPYEMGRGPEEVSEETASVRILMPQHEVFQFPNAITPRDFDGWFEQRGSKFWKTWDSTYTPLLECHDTGQAPQQGGQLVAKYGNGVYVYSAYAWYRQLPRGVPGAYRLFANLLSLPESDLVQ